MYFCGTFLRIEMNNETYIDAERVKLLELAAKPHIWDEQPVFCFTSDIDWASEAVIDDYFHRLPMDLLKLTTFVTHNSEIIENQFLAGVIQSGIHPNFLPGSSHGNSFREVIETCMTFAPEATCTRSHRAFDVTDTTHMLKNEFHYKCCSNTITTLTPCIKPYWLESKLLQIPVFFEEGSFLYNGAFHPTVSAVFQSARTKSHQFSSDQYGIQHALYCMDAANQGFLDPRGVQQHQRRDDRLEAESRKRRFRRGDGNHQPRTTTQRPHPHPRRNLPPNHNPLNFKLLTL